jgi:FPC/CPF motif-containing protein YcgG
MLSFKYLVTQKLATKNLANEEGNSSNIDFYKWRLNIIENFQNIVGQGEFPCVFARKANKQQSCYFLFSNISESSEENIQILIDGLTEYTDFCKKIPVRERFLKPLVVFFKTPSFYSLEKYHLYGWKILQLLHARDPHHWPDSIPTSPNESDWSFCFNDTQLFINMSSPKHVHWKSRNIGNCLAFVINPRENFDIVAPIHTKSGKKMREMIRERVKKYNGLEVFPEVLGFFGEKGNLEWRQYQLEEEHGLYPTQCPLRVMAKKGEKND